MFSVSVANTAEQKGASYIRWGRKRCGNNAVLVYEGTDTACMSYTLNVRMDSMTN